MNSATIPSNDLFNSSSREKKAVEKEKKRLIADLKAADPGTKMATVAMVAMAPMKLLAGERRGTNNLVLVIPKADGSNAVATTLNCARK